MDFLEDVVDIPIGIPFVVKVGSVMSFIESLRNEMLQLCPNLEGDIKIDFLFDWLFFSCLFSLFREIATLSFPFVFLWEFFVAKVADFITASAQTSKASRASS